MIAGILHDGGIVYPPGREPYVLVILTRGEPDPAVAAVVAADLSRAVWRELTGTGSR
jgi:beta-lactamase class A